MDMHREMAVIRASALSVFVLGMLRLNFLVVV